MFGIVFLDGVKFFNEWNGCWCKKINWFGNGFFENEKRVLFDFFFFGFYVINGVRDKIYFCFVSIIL